MEVALVSSKGESSSATIWNPETGSQIATYNGGGECPSHGLSANGGYVVSSEVNKPMLHAWPLNKQHKANKRLIAPGKITCVAISPDTNYLALSVENKLHVYQTASGVLCGSGSNNIRPINVVKFNSVGTLIGCGGEEGLLVVWRLGDIVQFDHTHVKPLLYMNIHSLPITDLVFTSGDLRSLVITVSLDRSCKIHSVFKKNKLFEGHFENQLTCLALCPKELSLYMGTTEGQIREVKLTAPPRRMSKHFSDSSGEMLNSKFHKSRVNSLSVSLDSNLLLSGSDDSTVKIIHIRSRQCVHTILQKGPITNCFFFVVPKNSFTTFFIPSLDLHDFTTKESFGENFSFDVNYPYDIRSNFLTLPHLKTDSSYIDSASSEIENLKRINNDLYLFAVEKLMGDAHSHQFQPPVFTDEDSKEDSNNTQHKSNSHKKKNRKKNKLK